MTHDNWSPLFDAILGVLVFLGSFVPSRLPGVDEPDEAFQARWKRRLTLMLRFAGLALLLLALARLLGS